MAKNMMPASRWKVGTRTVSTTAAWKTPDVMEAPAGKLTAQQNPNIRVQETLKPVAVFDRPDGKYILDMGQNMVGWLSVNLKGKKGKPVSMKFA